jgi:hypothetical protein
VTEGKALGALRDRGGAEGEEPKGSRDSRGRQKRKEYV